MLRFLRKTAAADASSASGERAIRAYLESAGLDGRAAVSPDGSIAAVENVDPSLLRSLRTMVADNLGLDAPPPVETVSPIEFRRRLDEAGRERKSGSRQAEAVRAGNETVEYILGRAIDAGASDVYLDIRHGEGTLSWRVYGRVSRVETLDRDTAEALARGLFSRTENAQWQEREPCDGSFGHAHGERLYRVRVNSLPDTRGQSLSCRIRDPGFVLPLDEAGYSDHQTALIGRICRAPGGMILVTGETNSGKSTTLASLMVDAPRGERMIEIADPVEVEMEHCTHVEIDRYAENAEARFRAVLAATVRQNPDSLVLGEIRDAETALAAQSMAIQGKRVLSTLHTQSCVAAIPRIMNLGVDPHLLALREFLAGIVNQNLVPLVCPHCGLDRHPDPKRRERFERLFGPGCRHVDPRGCERCVGGVSGQTLVAEVYPLWLDRADAHRIIAENELWRLEDYMKRTFSIQSKHDHARTKVLDGLVDPEMTEAIIGEWREPGEAPARSARPAPGPLWRTDRDPD